MDSPRRNLELKAIDPDPERSLKICEDLGAEPKGILRQQDIYFNVPQGRLMLRRQNDAIDQLIAYQRSDRETAPRRPRRHRPSQAGRGRARVPVPGQPLLRGPGARTRLRHDDLLGAGKHR
jgi:hypothetical protein